MAKPRFNIHTQKFEMAEDDWELRFNMDEQQFEYAPPGATLQQVQPGGTFKFAPEGATARFNTPSGRFELAKDDWTEQYNIHTGQFEYAPPSRTSTVHDASRQGTTDVGERKEATRLGGVSELARRIATLDGAYHGWSREQVVEAARHIAATGDEGAMRAYLGYHMKYSTNGRPARRRVSSSQRRKVVGVLLALLSLSAFCGWLGTFVL